MANYVQRVAASGARTVSAAFLPPAAPPRLPVSAVPVAAEPAISTLDEGRRLSGLPMSASSSPREAREQPRPEATVPGLPPRAPASAAPNPALDGLPAVPKRREGGPDPIRMPKALRPAESEKLELKPPRLVTAQPRGLPRQGPPERAAASSSEQPRPQPQVPARPPAQQPSAAAPRPSVPAPSFQFTASPPKEPRITIGRVDVQVNHRAPQPQAPSRRSTAADGRSSFDTGTLSRFFLRP